MSNTYTNPDEWYKDHWQDLKDYVGEYVAFSKDGVIDHDVDYLTMVNRIQLDYKDYIIDRIFENEFIDGHSITAPIAWLPTEQIADNLIGREVVFDAFDIEFKQTAREIIFKYRGDWQ